MLTEPDCLHHHHSPELCSRLNRVTVEDSVYALQRLPNAVVDLVIQDPPYGIDFSSNFRKNKIQTTNGIQGDGKDNLPLLDANLRETVRVMKPDAHLYMFTRWDKAGDHTRLLEKHGLSVKNHLVWRKNNWSMGDLKGAYASQYEVILFAQKGNKPLQCIPTADGRLNKHGAAEICRHPDILEFDRPANGKTMVHNHQKPVELLQFLMQKSSQKGDVVLDGFFGSGSTGIAAKNLDRNFLGYEIDPEVAKLAEQRLKTE